MSNAPWVFGGPNKRFRGIEVVNGEGKLLTVTEAIKQGGLDWLVQLEDPISAAKLVETTDHNGVVVYESVPADEWRQVVKVEDLKDGDRIVKRYRTLGMVKGRYTPLQNRAAFAFFDRATMEGAAIIKAVGHLDHGRVVWAVAQRPESMELYPGDVVHQNLILLTAHDGSHAVKVMFAPHRASTGAPIGFRTARRMNTEVRVRHTASIEERMKQAHNVLAAETDYFDRWRTALVDGDGDKQAFKNRIVSEDQIRRVVSGLFPAKKKLDEDGNKYEDLSDKARKARERILAKIEEQEKIAKTAYEAAGVELPRDEHGNTGKTALDVFLGVSEYISKERSTRNKGEPWVASTFGSGAAMRQKAFDLIAKL